MSDKRVLLFIPLIMALLALALIASDWAIGTGEHGGAVPPPPDATQPVAPASPSTLPDREQPVRRRRADPPPVARETESGAATGSEPEDEPLDGETRDPLPDVETATPRELARAAVRRHRDEAHREQMTIAWADTPLERVPEDAEIDLIKGYINFEVARVRWNAGSPKGRLVRVERHWGRIPDAEGFESSSFDVSPQAFRNAWHAARLVLAARAQHRQPPDPLQINLSRGGGVSHASHYVVRLRHGGTLLCDSSTRGQTHLNGIRDWTEIQDRATYDLLDGLVPKAGMLQHPTPLTAWAAYVTDEIAAATTVDEYAFETTERLRMDIALRIAGEAGDSSTLAAVESLVARVRTFDSDHNSDLVADAEGAHTRLRLRTAWDQDLAATVIHEGWGDLLKWTRRKFARTAPEAYFELLRTDLASADDPRLLRDSIVELLGLYPERSASLLGPILEHEDPNVRIEAALGLLDYDAWSGKATAALERLASDTSVHPEPWQKYQGTPRRRALMRLRMLGRWDTARLRRQVAAPGEDGRMIQELGQLLALERDPLSELERREAFRRVLEGRPDDGLLVAMAELIALDDVPYFDRIAARIDELIDPENKANILSNWARRRMLPELKAKLAAARREHAGD